MDINWTELLSKVISSLLTFLGVAAAAAGSWYLAKSQKRKNQADAAESLSGATAVLIDLYKEKLTETESEYKRKMDVIREENEAELTQLKQRVAELEERVAVLEVENQELKQVNDVLKHGARRLHQQLESHEIKPVWSPV